MRVDHGILAAVKNSFTVRRLTVAGSFLAALLLLADWSAAQYPGSRGRQPAYDPGYDQQDGDQDTSDSNGAPEPYGRPPSGGQDYGQPGYGQQQPRYGQPAYQGQPATPGQPPRPGQQPSSGQPASAHEQRCRALEQQLSSDWGRGQGREQLPRLEEEMRQNDRIFQKAQYDIEQANCYEDAFIFGRSLKHTPRCMQLSQAMEDARRRLTLVREQRESLLNRTSSRGHRDNVVAELARNNCGETYQRQYASQQQQFSNPLASLFGDDNERLVSDGPGWGGAGTYGTTYRTMCVRLCDGYFFPVSYAASDSKFRDDEARCQQNCAAPAALYTYRNPGEDADNMVSLDGRPYKELPNAFRNRKQYIKGCSCRATEYSQQEIVKSERTLKAEADARRTAAAAGKGKNDRGTPPAAPAPAPAGAPPTEAPPAGEGSPRG
jgi:hypothetical protein